MKWCSPSSQRNPSKYDVENDRGRLMTLPSVFHRHTHRYEHMCILMLKHKYINLYSIPCCQSWYAEKSLLTLLATVGCSNSSTMLCIWTVWGWALGVLEEELFPLIPKKSAQCSVAPSCPCITIWPWQMDAFTLYLRKETEKRPCGLFSLFSFDFERSDT